MANKKLKKEEIDKIVNIESRIQAVQVELGQVELVKLDLKKRRDNAINYLEDTRRAERELVSSLEESYGKGSINLQKGEFIPEITNTKK